MADDRDFEGLSFIADECWQTAEDHGWHQDEAYYQLGLAAKSKIQELSEAFVPDIIRTFVHKALERHATTHGSDLPELLMLIVSEASEALEVYRKKDLDPTLCYAIDPITHAYVPYTDGDPTVKPEGVGSELADIVIRVFDLARRAKINIVAEIRRKMRHNKTRPYRHGGKRA